jgi:lysozyme
MTSDNQKLRDYLKANEGSRLTAYDDATGCGFIGRKLIGNPTIAVGSRMDTSERFKGLTVAQMAVQVISQTTLETILTEDIETALAWLRAHLPWVLTLDDARCRVFVDMVFNMQSCILGFKHMLAAAEAGDWQEAAAQLMDSDYGRKTPARAGRNRDLLLNGDTA